VSTTATKSSKVAAAAAAIDTSVIQMVIVMTAAVAFVQACGSREKALHILESMEFLSLVVEPRAAPGGRTE
jgi:NADPH-dependent curcumin reductase CurA